MNLVGNRRAGAAELSLHLMNVEDNEHVIVHDLRGFIADDLDGALHEAYGISRGTRCKKFLYSLSLNPPAYENVPIDVFEAAIERIEQKLGFANQPRAIVFHEKKGRRHAHVVWSRIDGTTMTAIDPYQDKLSLNAIGRELFVEHGWNMPDGYKRNEDADPFNYSHAEHQQSKRAGHDPKTLKKFFAECWERSDSRTSFEAALKEHGFILAKGDRRAFVAVDVKGEVYSISRWIGVKTKEDRVRLGECNDLPTIKEAWHSFEVDSQKTTTSPTQDELERQTKLQVLEAKRVELVTRYREARSQLSQFHRTRRIEETTHRAKRLPVGIKGVWLKLSGGFETLQKELEVDAKTCDERDRAEYQRLIVQHLQESRELQDKIKALQVDDDLASGLLRIDPAQKLIIPPEPDAQTNKAKVERNPAYILNIITDKRETFTRPVVVRALAEYINDPLKLGLAADTAMQSGNLVEMEANPLPTYSTREMLNTKDALSKGIEKLSLSKGHTVSARYINSAISNQNDALQSTIGISLSDEQETAIRHCLNHQRISAVVGLAGAGKSTMLSAVHAAYQRQGMQVVGAALSGKAADGLESASGIKSRTLASLEQSWKKGFNQLTSSDVLVIDEAGMIGTRQLKRFIEQAEKTGAKVILVGDPEQLQPINAGTPFKVLVEQIGAVHLTEIHRQQKDWQKQASLDLAEGRVAQAIDTYELHGNVKQAKDNSGAILNLVENYMIDLSVNGEDKSRIALAYRRKDVFAINQMIRSARLSVGELPNQKLFQTKNGKRAFAPSDRILLTENNHTLGIRNGMIGTVKSVREDALEILLDANDGQSKRKVVINPKLYNSFDHGYATTIHKSQGATVDRSYVLGSVLMDRHLTYVAMTRHKQDATLYGDHTSLNKMRRSGMSETPRYSQSHSHSPRRGPRMH